MYLCVLVCDGKMKVRERRGGDLLKQVGFFIRCSKSKEPAKSFKFSFLGVPNNILFSYVSNYIERLCKDKISKNTDILWPGALYKHAMSHFLN